MITPIVTLSIIYFYGDLNPNFGFSCILHGIAALIEGAVEPMAVEFVLTFNYAVPASAETIAVFLKTVALYIMCIKMEMDALIAFGYSQIVFSVIFGLVIYRNSSQSLLNAIIPTPIAKG